MRVPVSQGENKVFLKVSFGDRLHIFEYKFAYTNRDQFWYVLQYSCERFMRWNGTILVNVVDCLRSNGAALNLSLLLFAIYKQFMPNTNTLEIIK